MLMFRNPVFWYGLCFILCALLAQARQTLAWQRYLRAGDAVDCRKPIPADCDVGINLSREGFWSLIKLVCGVFGALVVLEAAVTG